MLNSVLFSELNTYLTQVNKIVLMLAFLNQYFHNIFKINIYLVYFWQQQFLKTGPIKKNRYLMLISLISFFS